MTAGARYITEILREDLKSNLQEFETRVKTAADWRRCFAEHTGTMMAAAFGGGALLAAMIGGRSKRASLSKHLAGAEADRGRESTHRQPTSLSNRRFWPATDVFGYHN